MSDNATKEKAKAEEKAEKPSKKGDDHKEKKANEVRFEQVERKGSTYFKIDLTDAWVWDMYRPARFVKRVKVMTFRDVNIEELEQTSPI